MKDVKGILIDPVTKTITEVEIKDYDFQKIYPLIEASTFDVVELGENDALYVDGFGLKKDPPKPFFQWAGYHSPLSGRGLILGNDDEGDTVSTTLTVESVRDMASFPTGVRFEGFVPIPEGTRIDHPVLGNVPVFGEVPKFSRDN